MQFVRNSIPAIALTSVEVMSLINEIMVRDKDTLDMLNPTSIIAVVDFSYRLINQVTKAQV